MNFGEAIKALKEGNKVSRKGWNGKNMFLFLVVPTELELRTNSDINVSVVHQSIAMKTVDGSIVVGWLASQVDMLAEDWIVVE